ncbi:PucR family transcriptional regulator [Nocardioides marmotae]|uniref:PucR family transcriptional regulator n=1 Tax=Nocardioides marmotae TaxID=2663857 RepID=UPI0012B59798|nr:helix-turn-helix domain-containing protein [Nocardioides marmotae]MBC9732819.1 helix-turn-helix domain-containing protein [Nocardioides marmotae]MTB83933.1 PucR family transcriptional regulator [Nocardioides marmotae]
MSSPTPSPEPSVEPLDVDELAEGLAQQVLANADLGAIVDAIGASLRVDVAVTTTDGRERVTRLRDAVRGALEAGDLVDPTGRLRVERLDAEDTVLAGGSRVHRLQVATPAQPLGHLVVVADRALTELERVALRRAVTAVALSISRQQAVSAVENKYRGDFLRDVLLGRAGSEEFVREHVAGFGWDLGGPSIVLVAQLDPPPAGEPSGTVEEQRLWQERFADAWRQVLGGVSRAVPVADFGSEVVTVLPAEGSVPGSDPVLRLVRTVAGDKGGGRRPFSVGVGRLARDVRSLPESYAQAYRAVAVGRRVRGGGTTTWFDELGLHRLIAMVPDDMELRAFATDVLGELAGQTEEAAALRETLQVLLSTNFNVAEAARLQFFHYNTIRYRVTKLERLLGPITSDHNLRLDVAVALKVLEVVGG